MNKNYATIAMLATLLAAAFLLFGCTGPAGPKGDAGSNASLANLEGYSPNAKCGDCHTPGQDTLYHVTGRELQWSNSVHTIGGQVQRNNTPCSGCHTTEGFMQRMNGQAVTDQPNATPPGCFACHSPHARADFSLRVVTPVTIGSNITGVAPAVFDYGNGNLCVQCHQTRDFTPKPDPTKTAATDTIKITSNRWYSHYGVQGQMLMGEGGFKFVDYTYTGNSNHTTNTTIKQEGCPTCHMPQTVGTVKGGGHTMNIGYLTDTGTEAFALNGCNQSGCHASITKPDIAGSSTGGVGAQTLISRNLDTLKTLLVTRGWLDTTGTEITVKASSTAPLKIHPASRAGALYNFMFITHDLSEGVHNTKYALELLRSSIIELRKP